MYDDILNDISYSVIFDGGYFLNCVFTYAQNCGLSFFALVGIYIGAKFLKSVFDV